VVAVSFCKPWEDKTCEAEEMKDFCVQRAVTLCENAFGALPQVAEGTQTAGKKQEAHSEAYARIAKLMPA